MTPGTLTWQIYTGLTAAAAIAGPPLAVAALVGLIVGILQAVTQIQDASLTQTVKIVAIGASLFVVAGRLVTPLYEYTLLIFATFPQLVR